MPSLPPKKGNKKKMDKKKIARENKNIDDSLKKYSFPFCVASVSLFSC